MVTQYINPNQDTGLTAEQVKKNLISGGFTQEANKIPTDLTILTAPKVEPSNIPTNTSNAFSGVNDYTKTYSSGNTYTPPPVTTDTPEQIYAKQLAGVAPESSVDLMKKLEEEKGIETKTKSVNALKAQIDAINAETRAKTLSLVGQGRGIPQSVIGGQQAQIEREAAIRSLPLTAQYQAELGDLQSAQDSVDRLFNATVADRKAQNDYKTKLIDHAYQFATDKEKKALDEQKEKTRVSEREQDKLDKAKEQALAMAKEAGDYSITGKIVSATDLNSLAEVTGTIKGLGLDQQYKTLQIEKLKQELSGETPKLDSTGKTIIPKSDATKINKELITSDPYKAIIKGQDSLQFLKNFEELFSKTGATSAFFSPRENAELKAKYNAAILNLKEFFNLGVLNGPDEAILRSVLPDPTDSSTLKTIGTLGISLPAKKTEAGINSMKAMIEQSLDTRFDTLNNLYGEYSPESVSAIKDVQTKYINQKAAINPEVKKLVDQEKGLTPEEIISIIKTK